MPPAQPYPDLTALDLLVSVGKLGSISAAAQAQGITQPAASMRLSALERRLKIQLLERATTGARLTPAGMATAEWAATVLADMQSLLVGVAALLAEQGSRLRVAASLTVAEYLIPGGSDCSPPNCPRSRYRWRWATPPTSLTGYPAERPSWASSRAPGRRAGCAHENCSPTGW